MAWPSETRFFGKPMPRLDGPAKISGRAKYTSDVAPAGCLHGAILRSQWPAARIRKVDLARARAMPGIKAAFAVQEGEFSVHYYGAEIAAVAGVSRQAVEDALRVIGVDAIALPFVATEHNAIKSDAPRVDPGQANLSEGQVRETGDVDTAFAAAAAFAERTFETQVEIHQPMEPHSYAVAFDGEEVTVWASTQGVFAVRDQLARALGIPQSKVRVICEHMGGGFGSKLNAGPECILCARLAQAAGAPVKLVLTRFEQALAVGNRPSSHQELKLAADADGKVTAFEMVGFNTPGYVAGGARGGALPMPYIYVPPNTRVKQANLAINAGPSCPFRAPGHPVASFAMEGILDDVAAKLDIDPVEMRLRNDPSEIRRREYALGGERFGWKEKYRKSGSAPGPVKIGVGCAGAAWMSGGRGTQAEMQLNSDGTVEVRCGTQDLGTGSRTVIAVIAAEMLGIDPALISVRVGDTRLPPSGSSGGSQTTASVGPAIFDACENALAELKKASGVEDPRGAEWKTACAKLGRTPLVVAGRWREGLSTGGACGVQFAEVAVDTETGFVQVRKVLVVQDCGAIVNTLTCESQINGGVIMGLGYALYEQRVMDARTGVVLNPNLETYKLPGAADIPEIEILLLDMRERGIIGVGEPATVPTAAAIANAVANAIGVRIATLPITPDKVLAALGELPSRAPAETSGIPELHRALAHTAASAAPRQAGEETIQGGCCA